MSRKTLEFGIDLGTIRSSLGDHEGFHARVTPDTPGYGITPAVVWMSPAEPGALPLVLRSRREWSDLADAPLGGDPPLELPLSGAVSRGTMDADLEPSQLPEGRSETVLGSEPSESPGRMGPESQRPPRELGS